MEGRRAGCVTIRRTNKIVGEIRAAMESMMEMDISGCISNAIVDGELLGWNHWSPVMDWGHFGCTDELQGLIESMIADGVAEGFYGKQEFSTSVSSSSTNCPGTPAEEILPGAVEIGDEDMGLRLVHLLMAAAEALTGDGKSRDLARVILARLRVLLDGGAGGSMERLAAYFTDALQGLLVGDAGGGRLQEEAVQDPGEMLEAFQLLQDMSPYVKFGHFTANQAIMEAVGDDRRVHVVDFNIAEGAQWASLMQAFVSRKDGQQPPPHLRITAVMPFGAGRRSKAAFHQTGKRLTAFAASMGIPFSFGECRLGPDEQFRPGAVKVFKGEAMALNCVMNLPHLPRRSAASVGSFLASAATLGARVVTLVEEEGSGRRGEEQGGFVGWFMEELQRFSAIWDSLEAGFPKQGRASGMVERVILGPRIASTVGEAYRRLEGGEEAWDRWGEKMDAAGFKRVGLSFFSLCQAKLLLGLFNDGYRVEEEAPNKLVLCWKTSRLLSTSVWSPPPPPQRSLPPSPAEICFTC